MNIMMHKKMTKTLLATAISSSLMLLSFQANAQECNTVQTYVGGGNFNSGDIVANNGNHYECVIGGWCQSDSTLHYEPGSGLNWGDAWKAVSCDLSSIDDNDTATDTETATGTDTGTDTQQPDIASHWSLNNSDSRVRFITVKKEHVAEVQHFETLTGSLNQLGKLQFSIDLASVKTAIDIRDSRIQDFLFETEFLPKLHFTASIEMTAINQLQEGEVLIQTVTGELELHGNKKSINTDITIVKMGESLQVFSNQAILINSGDFDLDGGIEILRTLASLSSIGESVPVYFDLSFALNDFEAPAITQAPAAPTQLSSVFNENTASVELSWSDNANNEETYIVQKRVNNTYWSTVTKLNANRESYSESFSQAQVLEYRVFATSDSLSSDMSNISSIDISDYFNQTTDTDTSTDTSTNTATETETETDTNTETSTETSTDTDTDNDQITVAAGAALYRDKGCGGCHGSDGDTGVSIIENIREEMDLALYIEQAMPFGNAASCEGSCSLNIATYIMAEIYPETTDTVYQGDRGYRTARLLTPYEYQNAVQSITGFTVNDGDLPNAHFESEFKYPTQVDTGLVLTDDARDYMQLAEKISAATSLTAIGCNSSNCSDSQIRALGEKVFRRPLSDSEFNTYKSFNSSYGSKDLLASMLMSPYFLYRIESGEWDGATDAYRLNDYEVASALSFSLFGTTPDATLLNLAANGNLSTVEDINNQVDLMMGDQRFADHFVEFIRYYNKTYADTSEKPGLSSAVIASMQEEQREAISYLMATGSASINELFNPGYTFADNTLSSHYGMASVASNIAQKVSTNGNRGGILHQGMTQIMNSDFAATSLVKRGKMIRENMMCHNMGVPTGIDPATIIMPDHAFTTRERWNTITGPEASNGQCWQCHKLMNDPGSSLENFDQAGKYRESEQAYNDLATLLSIDASGILRDNSGENVLTTFSNARDMSEYMASSAVVRDCFTESLYRYNSGFKVTNISRNDITQVQAQFRNHGDIKKLSKAMFAMESFLYRVDH
ncbi:MAG: DUF1588 domain-containing protein [Pseudomonadales bacterium]|nr:DUF1588 domain-containing protein [Pseudomonadales bacterium]